MLGGRLPLHQHWLPKAAAAATVAAAGVAAGASLAGRCSGDKLALKSGGRAELPLASTSLSMASNTKAEAQSGVEFPSVLGDAGQQLAGTGLRKKSVLGLKSIVVYAFGIYADAGSLRQKLGDLYSGLSAEALKERKEELLDNAACKDVEMSVRLSIVYGNLKIASVRSAFEESIGGRLKKFGGAENKDLLQSFTSMFKDDIQLPKGTTIDISRHPGHVLKTRINDQEMGSVESELLCRCLFDLYIGQEPFDKAGRSAIGDGLVAMLCRSA